MHFESVQITGTISMTVFVESADGYGPSAEDTGAARKYTATTITTAATTRALWCNHLRILTRPFLSVFWREAGYPETYPRGPGAPQVRLNDSCLGRITRVRNMRKTVNPP